MATLAEIFAAVRLDHRQLPGDMKKALAASNPDRLGTDAGRSFTKGFGSGLARLTGVVGGVLGTLAVGRKITESVDAASDMNETVSKANTIFGKNSAAIQKWSNTAATSFGLSKSQALSAAAGFGDMFAQLGFTADAASKMSTSTVQMAADLGSFNNLPTADVLERISAGFRGEFDSLQAVIPNISAARVQTEALAISGKKNADSLTAQDKATAVLAIVQKDGARAMGDFSRTSAGYANQQKIAAAQTEDLKAKIGAGLLPAFVAGSTILNTQVLPPLAALATKHGPAVSKWLTDVSAKAGPFINDFLSQAGPKLKSLTDGTNEAAPALKSMADSGGKLAPVVKDLIDKVPSLTSVLSVSATALSWAADNTDTLQKIMPLLVAGIVAYKVAQLAANVVQVAAVPAKVAEVVVNRQLVKSNRDLIASRSGVVASTLAQTGATSANTAATAANTGATRGGRVAAIASAAAHKGLAVAQGVATVAQRALNLAMRMNPVGLVITAVALLAAGIVILWKRSETFRTVTTAVWNGFRSTAVTALQLVWGAASGFFSNLLTGAAKAFGWVPNIGPKLKTAATEFNTFKDRTNAALAKLKDKTVTVTPVIKNVTYTSGGVTRTQPLNNIASAGRLATGGPADNGFKVRGPGTPTNDKAGLFALSKQEWVIRAAAAMKYGDAAMAAVNAGRATIIPDGALATGGRAGVNLRTPMPTAAAYTSWSAGIGNAAAKAATPLATQLAAQVAQKLIEAGGGPSNPGLIPALNWARTQVGKPYLWGGVGPGGYDCSGIVSAVINRAMGKPPHRRLGATGSMPWSMFAPGTGPMMVGWFKGNPGHTGMTINGVNIESAGGVGVRMGKSARGAMNSMFTNRMRVKGFARGGTPRGEGRLGDLPFDLVNPRGDHFLGKGFLKQMGIEVYDSGGVATGTGLFAKGIKEPERMLSPRQTAAFERLVELLENGGIGGGKTEVHNHFPAASGAAAEEAANRFLAALGSSGGS